MRSTGFYDHGYDHNPYRSRAKPKKAAASARARLVAKIVEERGSLTRAQRWRFIWYCTLGTFALLAAGTVIRDFVSVRSDEIQLLKASRRNVPEGKISPIENAGISALQRPQTSVANITENAIPETTNRNSDAGFSEAKVERPLFEAISPEVNKTSSPDRTAANQTVDMTPFTARAQKMVEMLRSRGYYFSPPPGAQGEPEGKDNAKTKAEEPPDIHTSESSLNKNIHTSESSSNKDKSSKLKSSKKVKDDDIYCKKKEMACKKSTGKCFFRASCNEGDQ